MGEWRRVKIGDFLSARKGKYKPDDKVVAGLQRVDKIDFSGKIHLSEKGSKTDLIMVFPGDLLISGINVAKGAVAVYHGEKPVVATIHYSTYTFDESLVSIDYFRRFVRSSIFEETLKEQVRGGIKTEIKPKDFLPLQIDLPEIDTQNEIVARFIKIESELTELSGGIDSQATLIKQLRQAVLQEAVEGKLTAEWRKQHPVVKGDPQCDAVALLAQIKTEKERMGKEGKIRKEKPLPPITDTDKPFNLPVGWVWARLCEICDAQDPNPSHRMPQASQEGVPFISPVNVDSRGIIDFRIGKKVNHEVLEYQKSLFEIKNNSFAFARIGTIGTVFKLSLPQNYCLSYSVSVITPYLDYYQYIMHLMSSQTVLRQATHGATTNTIPDLGMKTIRAFVLPFPPLAEQQAIVARVDSLMAVIDDLEKQVAERKRQAQLLMQAVLREAFDESCN